MTEVARVLFGREDVRRRVAELGRTITGDYVGREPVFVTVLKGGAMFLADLMRAVSLPVEPHFMAISRYGDAEESLGRVQILLDVDVDLTGRDVILVEDIVDTGLTSRYLLSVLRVARRRLRRAVHAAGQGRSSDRPRAAPVRRFRVPGRASSWATASISRSGIATLPTSWRCSIKGRFERTPISCSRWWRRRPEVARRPTPGYPARVALIEMELSGVRVELPTNQPIALLREKGGERYLPIWIGPSEAAVDRDGPAGGRDPAADDPRPGEDDPGRSQRAGRADRGDRAARKHLLRRITLERGGEQLEISARPSDAMALAVRMSVPIFAAEEVLEEAAILIPGEEDEEVEKFREFLDNVTPEDFAS